MGLSRLTNFLQTFRHWWLSAFGMFPSPSRPKLPKEGCQLKTLHGCVVGRSANAPQPEVMQPQSQISGDQCRHRQGAALSNGVSRPAFYQRQSTTAQPSPARFCRPDLEPTSDLILPNPSLPLGMLRLLSFSRPTQGGQSPFLDTSTVLEQTVS